MKVLDLFCAHDHTFEGWFASEDDFQSQLARGLVQCPLCGTSEIRKGLSAPRLNLGAQAPVSPVAAKSSADGARSAPVTANGSPQSSPSTSVSNTPTDAVDPRLQAAWLQWARQVVAQTEDVGSRFAQEARRIHYGETEERPIRGQATARETAELLEEGVAVMPLPLPDSAKETLQ